MDNTINNFVIIAIIGLLIYFIFSNVNLNVTEGMTTNDANVSPSENGVAGNASSFAAQLKNETIKMQDTLLISKYRKDYENVVINMDDYVNNLMLNTILNYKSSGNLNKDIETIDNLNKLNNAKTSLNSVMKFIDRT